MALTQQIVPSKLRHLQSFVSSGVFYPPAGTTVVYVAVLGATGGVGSSGRYSGGAGGSGPSSGGYVQVNPQAPHTVSIGAGGVAPGGAAGTTSFDGAITVTGSAGGNSSNESGWGSNGNTGASGSASSTTNLPELNPGGSTIVRVTSSSSGSSRNTSSLSGIVHIYGY